MNGAHGEPIDPPDETGPAPEPESCEVCQDTGWVIENGVQVGCEDCDCP